MNFTLTLKYRFFFKNTIEIKESKIQQPQTLIVYYIKHIPKRTMLPIYKCLCCSPPNMHLKKINNSKNDNDFDLPLYRSSVLNKFEVDGRIGRRSRSEEHVTGHVFQWPLYEWN